MIRNVARVVAVLGVLVAAAMTLPALGQTQAVRIAVHTSLGGEDDPSGRSYLDGVRFAIDEANESGIGPHIELDIHSDKGSEQGAREVAEKIAASQAPGYLRYALNGRRAAVIFVDNAYGRTLADGFRRGAEWLGITATFHGFASAEARDGAVRQVAADPDKPVAVLGMLQSDAWATIKALRRQGFTPAIFGGTDVAETSFTVPFAASRRSSANPTSSRARSSAPSP